MYNVTTVVSETPTGSLGSIDDKGFNRNKIDFSSSTFGLQSFETQFLDSKWATYYQSPIFNDNPTTKPSLGGSLVPLAATMLDPGSDFDPVSNVIGPLDQTRRVKQRLLEEALKAVFVSVGNDNAQKNPGLSYRYKDKTACRVLDRSHFRWHSSIIGGYSRPHLLQRRALNLDRDPGSPAAVVSIVPQDAHIRKYSKGFNRLLENSTKTILGSTIFGMVNGQLGIEGDERIEARDSTPFIRQGI